MKKKLITALLSTVIISAALCGCGGSSSGGSGSSEGTAAASVSTSNAGAVSSISASDEKNTEAASASTAETSLPSVLEDGVYTAEFNTDSSMFHVNEMLDGKGTLTVENGQMTIHVSLVSQNIINMYPGTAEDSQKEGAVLLQPTTDTIDYQDGTTEDVSGFDVPVPVIGEEFDLAIIGTKGKWYDHKVSVTNPVPVEETAAE